MDVLFLIIHHVLQDQTVVEMELVKVIIQHMIVLSIRAHVRKHLPVHVEVIVLVEEKIAMIQETKSVGMNRI